MSIIARTVFETETIRLINGDEITLRPLQIKWSRQVVKMYRTAVTSLDIKDNDPESDTKMQEFEDTLYDALLAMTLICINKVNTEKSYTLEELEEFLDEQTMNHILKVCASIDLDPKAQESQIPKTL